MNRAGFAARYADRSASVAAPVDAVLFRDDLDLLADPAFDDDVVTIQSEPHTFAIQDLIAHVCVDQVTQLGGRGFASFRRHVLCDEIVHHSLGDDELRPPELPGAVH